MNEYVKISEVLCHFYNISAETDCELYIPCIKVQQ